MDLVCKVGNPLLLTQVELTLVHTVSNHVLAQLSAAHMMQDKPLLTGINHFAVIQSSKLLSQLCFFCELRQDGQDFIVNGSGAVIERHSRTHGSAVFSDPLGATLTGHYVNQVHPLYTLQLLIRSQGIHVFPCNHVDFLLICRKCLELHNRIYSPALYYD